MKGLIVTADDFGAAREVNEAVEIAHRDGILTAASLMVAAPAAREAVALAGRLPSLHVGLHIVLVDGRAMLPHAQIPDLVDRDGTFRSHMAAAGARMFFLPKVRRQLEAEIAAQFEAFRATGLALDHVNAHKHFHLHPTIAATLLRVGRKFGLKALRVPREPKAVLARVERGGGRPLDVVAGLWASRLKAALARQELFVPDQVFGLRWSGAMTKNRLLSLIENLPEGVSEIYLHPAVAGGYAGAAPGYRYRDEFLALVDTAIAGAVRKPGLRRGGFSDFHSLPKS